MSSRIVKKCRGGQYSLPGHVLPDLLTQVGEIPLGAS